MSSRPGSRTRGDVFNFVFFQISLRKIMLESEAFRNRANLQTPFNGFSGFLVIAQKVFKPWFRKKLQMQGAQKLRSEAYEQVRCNDSPR
jgi:hypothetical protein